MELQSIRTYQRRLKKVKPSGLPCPKVPKSEPGYEVQQAHDEWQIDANERIPLIHPSNQQKQACYLNITDTKSHAILKAKPFPLWTDQPG